MKAYTAIYHIDRGAGQDPVKPGEVFRFEGKERDRLLDNGAIREATSDEIALSKGRGKSADSDVSDVSESQINAAAQMRIDEAERLAAKKIADAEKKAAELVAEAERLAAEKQAEAERLAAETIATASTASDANDPAPKNPDDGVNAAEAAEDLKPKSKAKSKAKTEPEDPDLGV